MIAGNPVEVAGVVAASVQGRMMEANSVKGELHEGTAVADGLDEVIPVEGGMMEGSPVEGRGMEATSAEGELPEGTTVADGWDEEIPVEGEAAAAAAALQAQNTEAPLESAVDWRGNAGQVMAVFCFDLEWRESCAKFCWRTAIVRAFQDDRCTVASAHGFSCVLGTIT